jgi:hypothetical protein
LGQSIPVGPWPDFETAEAFGGNAIKAAADKSGEVVTECAAVRRDDGLWMAEGFCHDLGARGPSSSLVRPEPHFIGCSPR